MSAQTEGDAYPILVSPRAIALVDAEDASKCQELSWCLAGKGRVRARHGDGKIYLHRFVLDARVDDVVDHINGDPLDNRKANLRVCSPEQNAKNRSRNKNSRSGFKGVRWHKATQKWSASIKADGKQYWLGVFDNTEMAAHAYDAAARRLHGQFAKTNF